MQIDSNQHQGGLFWLESIVTGPHLDFIVFAQCDIDNAKCGYFVCTNSPDAEKLRLDQPKANIEDAPQGGDVWGLNALWGCRCDERAKLTLL